MMVIKGTGFFCKIISKNSLLTVLITNNHILNDKDIDTNKIIKITLNDDNEFRNIKIDKSRIKFTNPTIDIIEIRPEIDKINNFLEIDEEINKDINILETIYWKKSVYLLHYQNSNNIKVSYGLLNGINEKTLTHYCNTEEGSSGAPILSLDNFKLIGVHKGSHKYNCYNLGIFIKYVIEELNKNNKALNEISNNEINIKNNQNSENNINEKKRVKENNIINNLNNQDIDKINNNKENNKDNYEEKKQQPFNYFAMNIINKIMIQ